MFGCCMQEAVAKKTYEYEYFLVSFKALKSDYGISSRHDVYLLWFLQTNITSMKWNFFMYLATS